MEDEAPSGTGKQLRDILYQISNRAHKYVIGRTQHLTALRDLQDATPAHAPSHRDGSKNVNAPSILPAYTTRRHSRSKLSATGPVPPFAKDYARVVHSPSFRRLQGKTQLIPAGENEFFRTRLTHSLEVADIATRIARKLNAKYSYFERNPIDYDLVACASLLHDIGHPPFGHSGEDVLNQRMERFGGFEGNAQTLRIVTQIENRLGSDSEVEDVVRSPRGLNLTVGTLASVLKYDQQSTGPFLKGKKVVVKKGYYPTEEDTVAFLHETLKLERDTRLFTIECQIMDLADDIAYSAYDLEDTLEAGIVTPLDLMSIEDSTLEITRVQISSGGRR